MKKLFILIFFCLSCSTLTLAQRVYHLAMKESKMMIHGTSTLHNWQCRVEQANSQLTAEVEAGEFRDAKALSISIVVSSIRSVDEKGAYYEKGMDKNVYKALKAEKFPAITFTLTKMVKRTINGKNIAFDVKGILRIAGVSKEISLHADAIPVSDGIVFEGKIPIKMTDYNVEPPTAIFGTIKTGNEIMLEFKMVYRIQSTGK